MYLSQWNLKSRESNGNIRDSTIIKPDLQGKNTLNIMLQNAIRWPFADSVDTDQTTQNMQSVLGSTSIYSKVKGFITLRTKDTTHCLKIYMDQIHQHVVNHVHSLITYMYILNKLWCNTDSDWLTQKVYLIRNCITFINGKFD